MVLESGSLRADHILNGLARLTATAPLPSVETSLQLKVAPVVNTARYDQLRTTGEESRLPELEISICCPMPQMHSIANCFAFALHKRFCMPLNKRDKEHGMRQTETGQIERCYFQALSFALGYGVGDAKRFRYLAMSTH